MNLRRHTVGLLSRRSAPMALLAGFGGRSYTVGALPQPVQERATDASDDDGLSAPDRREQHQHVR